MREQLSGLYGHGMILGRTSFDTTHPYESELDPEPELEAGDAVPALPPNVEAADESPLAAESVDEDGFLESSEEDFFA